MNHLDKYLSNKLKEKGWSPHHLHVMTVSCDIEKDPRNGIGVSYTQIKNLLNNKVPEPRPSLLKKISRALNVEYYEMMIAAGYIDISELSGFVREILGPVVSEDIVDLLTNIDVVSFLKTLNKLPENRLSEALMPATAMVKGLMN